MMKLQAKKNTYDVKYILPRGNELAISLDGNYSVADVAADMDGLSVIRATEETPNITHVYEGYTQLTAVQKMSGGNIRVLLARE